MIRSTCIEDLAQRELMWQWLHAPLRRVMTLERCGYLLALKLWSRFHAFRRSVSKEYGF